MVNGIISDKREKAINPELPESAKFENGDKSKGNIIKSLGSG